MPHRNELNNYLLKIATLSSVLRTATLLVRELLQLWVTYCYFSLGSELNGVYFERIWHELNGYVLYDNLS